MRLRVFATLLSVAVFAYQIGAARAEPENNPIPPYKRYHHHGHGHHEHGHEHGHEHDHGRDR